MIEIWHEGFEEGGKELEQLDLRDYNLGLHITIRKDGDGNFIDKLIKSIEYMRSYQPKPENIIKGDG